MVKEKKKADHIRKYYKVENIKTRVTSCDASIMFIIRIKIDLVQVNFSDVDDLFPNAAPRLCCFKGLIHGNNNVSNLRTNRHLLVNPRNYN